MTTKLLFVLSLISYFLVSGCMKDEYIEKLPSKNIDVNKYLGVWHEIARLPNWFEKDLVGVTATYSLKENGKIEVFNQGYIKTLDGASKKSIGEAWIENKKQTGRLKVSFFWPFAADYVVLDIDDDYEYALVGAGKEFLWILSRNSKLDDKIYNALISKAKDLGFDTTKLVKVKQKS
jgi:apolipoprotein D and lipocalin family protein